MLASNKTDTCNPTYTASRTPWHAKSDRDLCQTDHFSAQCPLSWALTNQAMLIPLFFSELASTSNMLATSTAASAILPLPFHCHPRPPPIQSHLFLSSHCCWRALLTSQDLLGRQGRRHGSQILTFCWRIIAGAGLRLA